MIYACSRELFFWYHHCKSCASDDEYRDGRDVIQCLKKRTTGLEVISAQGSFVLQATLPVSHLLYLVPRQAYYLFYLSP